VDLARRKVVTFNDKVDEIVIYKKMAEIVLEVNGEYAILRLLAEYFL